MLVKIKYIYVHSDNNQGASGKPIIDNMYVRFQPETTIKQIVEYVEKAVDTDSQNWPKENKKILSIEIIKEQEFEG